MPVPQPRPFQQKRQQHFNVREITGGMSPGEVLFEINRGARFVAFPYVISVVYTTLIRQSPVRFIPAGQSTLPKAIPFALVSLVLGWWNLPHGLLHTPEAIYRALKGGKDVTPTVVAWAQKHLGGQGLKHS